MTSKQSWSPNKTCLVTEPSNMKLICFKMFTVKSLSQFFQPLFSIASSLLGNNHWCTAGSVGPFIRPLEIGGLHENSPEIVSWKILLQADIIPNQRWVLTWSWIVLDLLSNCHITILCMKKMLPVTSKCRNVVVANFVFFSWACTHPGCMLFHVVAKAYT